MKLPSSYTPRISCCQPLLRIPCWLPLLLFLNFTLHSKNSLPPTPPQNSLLATLLIIPCSLLRIPCCQPLLIFLNFTLYSENFLLPTPPHLLTSSLLSLLSQSRPTFLCLSFSSFSFTYSLLSLLSYFLPPSSLSSSPSLAHSCYSIG